MSAKAIDFTAFTIIPIAFSVIDGLAVILLLFRLSFRLQIQRFWWEDVWAAVVVICGTIFIITQLICSETGNHETAFISSWLTTTSFTSTVWAVRMSLLYSTIRVIPPSTVLRKVTRVIPFLFLVFWATLIALKIWWCNTNTKPIGNVHSMCVLSELIVLLELITDCISDAALVILSLRLFWRVKLPRRQRRMILCLFSSTAVNSMFSLFHAICQLVGVANVEYVAFELELTSSLIVCDLLVIVTYMYRVILSSPNGSLPSESESSSEDDDFTTRPTASLTTVDLNTVATTVTDSNFTSGIISSLYRSSAA